MVRLPKNMAVAARFAVHTGALAAFALTLRCWCFNTAALNAVYYTVYPASRQFGIVPFVIGALVAAGAAWKLFPEMRKSFPLLPAWLLWGLLALPADFPNLAAALAVTAWCLQRILGARTPLFRFTPRQTHLLVALTAAAAAAWSWHLQKRAYATMLFAYQDWGEYTECYLKLIAGKLPLRSFPVQAGHFNPLSNLLMTTILRAWRSPDAVFMTSALLSGSLPPLAYRLGREYRLPGSAALAGAVATAFNPVLINQSLSFFYGFHPVLWSGPAILCFFICERRKCRSGMAAAMLWTLLVQETAAVLWFGYALYLSSRKKFAWGAGLGAFCVVFFLSVSKIVIPFATGTAVNPQMFHYAQLGDSLTAVLLSPLLRPRAFAATIFQYQNLCFVSALLLPVGILALRAPRRLLIGVPLLIGVLMQSSPDVKNPAMQYGFEISVIILAAAIAAAGGSLSCRKEAEKRLLRAGLRAMTVMTLLCALGWSLLPIGLYSARWVLRRPDATQVIASLRRFSENGGRVLSTKRLRLYHMFDREIVVPESPLFPGDTVIIDLDDSLDAVGELRRRVIADERAMPVFSTNFYGRNFAVWKIAPPGTPRPALPFMLRCSEEKFSASGVPLPQEDSAFDARLARSPNGGGVLMIRVRKKVRYDVAPELKMRQSGKAVHLLLRFGDGVYPAWRAMPGEVYCVALPGAFPGSVRLRLLRRD